MHCGGGGGGGVVVMMMVRCTVCMSLAPPPAYIYARGATQLQTYSSNSTYIALLRLVCAKYILKISTARRCGGAKPTRLYGK